MSPCEKQLRLGSELVWRQISFGGFLCGSHFVIGGKGPRRYFERWLLVWWLLSEGFLWGDFDGIPYFGTPYYIIERITILQDKIIRSTSSLPFSTHAGKLFKSMHVLRVNEIHFFSLPTPAFKSILNKSFRHPLWASPIYYGKKKTFFSTMSSSNKVTKNS